MKIRFLGPLGRVTGSCYHIVDGRGRQLLVDCGIVQDELGAQDWNEGPFPFDPTQLFAVFLTHAHIDHCGLVPRLYKEGFTGNVYCTEETAAIARVALLDAVRIHKAPFTERDVQAVRWLHPKFDNGFSSLTWIAQDLALAFTRTGHIVGAVSLTLALGPIGPDQRRITFSGDLGPNTEDEEQQALLGYRMQPHPVDYAVCESTYGSVVRAPLPHLARLDALEAALAPAVEAGGTAIIPVFAIGRAQDVLFDVTWLFARNPERFAGVDVVFHSTMGAQVNEVYAKALTRMEITKTGKVRATWRNKQLQSWLGLADTEPHNAAFKALLLATFGGRALDPSATADLPDLVRNWKAVHRTLKPGDWAPFHPDGKPRIVIAAGGMCEGGAVVRYLDGCLRDPRTTVAFTGYQGPNTFGGKLLRLKGVSLVDREQVGGSISYPFYDAGVAVERTIPLAEIHAQITQVTGYSAHADQAGLLKWLLPLGRNGVRGAVAPTVFLTHGPNTARKDLAQALRSAAPGPVRVESPADNRWFDLAEGCYEGGEAVSPVDADDNESLRVKLLAAYDWIRWAAAQGVCFPFDPATLST